VNTTCVVPSRNGIEASAGTVNVRNTFIDGNGDQFQLRSGIMNLGATVNVVYSTIVRNDGSMTGTAIKCVAGSADVRNSIILGGNGSSVSLDCSTLTLENTGIDDAALGMGTNVNVGAFMPGWFISAGTDYHLSMTTPFADIAQWITGDPTADFDGDARPTATTGYPGADEPT